MHKGLFNMDVYNLDKCTYELYGSDMKVQHWYHCDTCYYGILICEQVDDNNLYKIREKVDLEKYGNVRVIELNQNYPNPLGFNMLESYGKNKCLAEAKGEYVCMTAGDQIFSESIFKFIKSNLEKEEFYRFATYEIARKAFPYDEPIENIVDYCNKNVKKLCNPGMFKKNKSEINVVNLGEKSGDIMIMDTESFKKIKGFPENIAFMHVDMSVCFVAFNNFECMIVDQHCCTYTFEQDYREADENRLEMLQAEIAVSYYNKIVCN